MRTRKLALKKEALAELTTGDLAHVVAGANITGTPCASDFVACTPTSRCTLRDCVVTVQGCFTSLDVC
jgi:hypothetical protein